ncbi:IS5 family transposase [Thalassorhabdomicrobium marinisediminis]|uniref:IS5 family transposase n=1 Tax=Thalassorhabdomicrobium marinisediminis TaxID=2170577 RepID=A0A2T7FZB2_9RHOB|nr:IS5 family transposase [Thalassorhabdomicrobium marinisediminis]PVA07501.1 IS5 family transposase [Thalassorhabdomicrobium marinisediminis]
MKHRDRPLEQDDLLRPRLVDLIDMRHELVKLAALIDWEFFEREWAGFFPSGTGRPATPPRLVAGLMYLQHLHRLSDEAVVERWVENPYFQHFAGEVFFQHQPPIHPSSLSRWRDRIGDEGAEWLLTKTIEAGRSSGVVDDDSLSRVSIDTTVMEKNTAYPTDARLYEKARAKIVALAQEAGVQLRQTYARKAPLLAAQVGRYAHARQFKRMRKALRTLKGYTGRVMRDLRRQIDLIPPGTFRETVLDTLILVSRLLHQAPRGGGKIYALHEPAVDCISKGKARVRYEFGTKVSIATTINEGFVVGMRALPGNPYDGHTLAEALEQVEILTEQRPTIAVVDRGYRGHGVETTRVLISGSRRGLTPSLKALLRRRSAIEPEIGHMKTDGRLARCPLKGTRGDAIFAVLCGCGHNIRKILNHLRYLLAYLLAAITTTLSATVIIRGENQRSRPSAAA